MRLVATCGTENGQNSLLFTMLQEMHGASLFLLNKTTVVTNRSLFSAISALCYFYMQVSNTFGSVSKA